MNSTLIKNAKIVNELRIQEVDVRITGQRIERIEPELKAKPNDKVIDAKGLYLLPGMIDDQVHFREPGLATKGTIATESRAAVAGGITSFMEMPNVIPATTNMQAIKHKMDIAHKSSLANYSFYLGATNNNLEDIKRIDPTQVCGVKVFMGASTGNLLVDNPKALEDIFQQSPVLIATHCEDNETIKKNLNRLKKILPEREWQAKHHPIIRNADACYASSSYAVGLAQRFNADLHVLHLTTEKELSLFTAGEIDTKKITAEACVHHLWFNDKDYEHLGNFIKCNPAIKSEKDRQALIKAINDDVIDIIATDHAPHTKNEKNQPYSQAPAGLPLVQHALLSLLEQVHNGVFSLEKIVEKVCHNPAKRYAIKERGFIKEGYFADLVLVDLDAHPNIIDNKLYYQCQWSVFENYQFKSKIKTTFVNGVRVFDNDCLFQGDTPAQPLYFQRKK
jgi:dihydroorotase